MPVCLSSNGQSKLSRSALVFQRLKKSKNQVPDMVESTVARVLSPQRERRAGICWGGGLPSLAEEIPLSGGREVHLQDFTAPLFIT